MEELGDENTDTVNVKEESPDDKYDKIYVKGVNIREVKNSDNEKLSFKEVVKIDSMRQDFWYKYYSIVHKHFKGGDSLYAGTHFNRLYQKYIYQIKLSNKNKFLSKWQKMGLL